jgi:hypothetical protein
VLAIVLVSAPARAEKDEPRDDTTADQLVLVNATAKLGDVGQIARLRRVLSSRGLLFKLPENLEAALDGRNVLVADIDAIKEAFFNTDYATALKIIESDEKRVLGGAAGGDPVPALAELSQWRGLIAAGLGDQDEAVRQFRAAYRLNPAWAPDKKLASPRVRALVKQAHKDPSDTGVLRVDADPSEAMISIDGGEIREARGKITLPVGVHLVMVTAAKRKPYAELVEIATDAPYKLTIALDKESTLDRAARLVDETVAAPPGKARLKRAGALSRLTGATRLLVIEDGGDDHVTLRMYDVELKKVSKPLELLGDASSAAIARKVKAALEPDNLIDVSAVLVTTSSPPAESHWYQKWYVWAGVAAIAGGGFASYEYMTREPTSVRGF